MADLRSLLVFSITRGRTNSIGASLAQSTSRPSLITSSKPRDRYRRTTGVAIVFPDEAENT